MEFNPDYWIPERAAYLAQLGHDINLREWGYLWPEQIRVRLIDLGWSPSAASDFAFARDAEELQFAALGRACEIAKKTGKRDTRAASVTRGISREYQREQWRRQDEERERSWKESEKRYNEWLDNYVAEIFRNAIPYYPPGTGFQRRSRR